MDRIKAQAYFKADLSQTPGLARQPQWERICLPAQEMQETQVRSLGQEDPWRRKWQPIPVYLAWKVPRIEEPEGYSPWGHKESDMSEHAHAR